MTADTLMTWYSSTKPLTSMCVGQCWERGKLQLDDPIAKHVPEFAQNGKDRVTIRHVLTHTSGFPNADLDPTVADRVIRYPTVQEVGPVSCPSP